MKNVKRIFAAAKKNDELELLIYDSIGDSYWGGGVTAECIKQQLNDAGDVTKISVRINSPGGDVFEGSAIYSLLTQHKARVECYIDGLAASAAFSIAMAGDKIHISESAMMMCHNAWGMCIGYAADMLKTADILNKVSSTMCDIYAQRSGMTSEEVQKLMDDETWMTADEAVEYGFADDVIKRDQEEDEEAQALAASFDLSKLTKKAPRATAKTEKDEPPAAAAPAAEPAAAAAEPAARPAAQANDECMCECPECKADDCENCSNEDCDDPNCDHGEGDEEAKAKALAEVELMREQFDVLSF